LPLVLSAQTTSPGVAGLDQALQLPGKNLLVAQVVRDGGHGGRVGIQCDCRQRRSIAFEAAQQFAGDVLRVGGAAAVAENVNTLATAQARNEYVSDSIQCGPLVGQCLGNLLVLG
jgi:hypothetical protein